MTSKLVSEGGVGMGTTYLHAVASLDGYLADERDDVGPPGLSGLG